MFDIGWSEMLVIAVVAIVVVGPRELPRMLRTFGKTMGQVRRTANDFKRQFDDALREAEREVDLADTRKELQSIAKLDPLKDVNKKPDQPRPSAGQPQTTEAAPSPSPVPESAGAGLREAAPLKTAALDSDRGSDAA